AWQYKPMRELCVGWHT
ncbi:hypothetical protein ACN38_g2891, partial [Penicillium nordicum]